MIACDPKLYDDADRCPYCYINRKWPGTDVCACYTWTWTGTVNATSGWVTIRQDSSCAPELFSEPEPDPPSWKKGTLAWLREREMQHQKRRPQDCGRHRHGGRGRGH